MPGQDNERWENRGGGLATGFYDCTVPYPGLPDCEGAGPGAYCGGGRIGR
jgi:hypothetical protein